MGRMVEAEVGQVLIDFNQDRHQIWIGERHGRRQITLLIGLTEAMALRRFIDGVKPDRPMTHELLDTTIRSLGGRVSRVEITGLHGGFFHAQLVLEDAERKEQVLEARPSDSIALALRAKAPLFVDEEIFNTAGGP